MDLLVVDPAMSLKYLTTVDVACVSLAMGLVDLLVVGLVSIMNLMGLPAMDLPVMDLDVISKICVP